ncbi:sulfotransferase 1B1-like [Argiope bruennichi]|uniref:sulfotransferase 1B1-like n=1 Tax=Argiope bruennichi TaxID=94029 RepID=UPI0024956BC6|nr:sulfotransferase 1B1-like [Argiope bruennichi]
MTATQEPLNSPYVQFVRGYPFPGSFLFKKKVLEEVMDYIPRSGDIIVSSYPKTGTTWLQYIVLQIISKGESFPNSEDMEKVFPYMERTGVEVLNSLKSPRTYMHHIPYNLMQKNEKAKVLYIYRRPEDTLVSYYHFSRNIRGSFMDFDQYFENFLSGNVGYGRYFEHILSYHKHKDDKNLLMISYEKLHANKKEEILRIARFLGEEYFNDIAANESILNKIIKQTSFDHMKSNISVAIPKVVNGDKGPEVKLTEIDFFRKGIVGDGKNLLSLEQLKRLNDVARSVLEGTEIYREWMEK